MSKTLAQHRLDGYTAASEGKPRTCMLANPRHREMWLDGWDCYKPFPPMEATFTISEEGGRVLEELFNGVLKDA